ncbi:hypothetical protein MIMGU_mgv1a0165711mg, partial [Erythranthe guttata]
MASSVISSAAVVLHAPPLLRLHGALSPAS